MTEYDRWLDNGLEDWYGDDEGSEDVETEEWDGPYPEDDYDYE